LGRKGGKGTMIDSGTDGGVLVSNVVAVMVGATVGTNGPLPNTGARTVVLAADGGAGTAAAGFRGVEGAVAAVLLLLLLLFSGGGVVSVGFVNVGMGVGNGARVREGGVATVGWRLEGDAGTNAISSQ